MNRFKVEVPEVWYQSVVVEAKNADEARRKVMEGDCQYGSGDLNYSHTIDNDDVEWEVTEIG